MFWVRFRSGAYGFRGLLWLCLGMAVLFTVSIGPFLAYFGCPGLSVLFLLVTLALLPFCIWVSGDPYKGIPPQ